MPLPPVALEVAWDSAGPLSPPGLDNGAEGGSAGVAVTTGNSGGASGDPFDGVINFGGDPANTITFDTVHPAAGGLGYRFDHQDTGISRLRVEWAGPVAKMAGWFYVWKENIPNVFLDLAGGFDDNSSQRRASVGITTGGFLALADLDSGPISTGIVPLAFGEVCRIAFEFRAHPTLGYLRVELYNGPDHDKRTPDEVLVWTGRNTGTEFEVMAFGYPAGVAQAGQQGPTWFDEIHAEQDETWTDLASRFRSGGFHYGRQSELDRSEVGEGSVLLLNQDRALDPSFAAGPYFANLVPMRPIRIRTTVAGNVIDVARGFVRSFPQTWQGKVLGECNVEFEDAFSALARIPLLAYSDEVLADAPVAFWKLQETAGTEAADWAGSAGGPFPLVYTGTPILGATPGPLVGGKGAVHLDGSAEYVHAPARYPELEIRGDLTLETWVDFDTTSGGYLVGCDDNGSGAIVYALLADPLISGSARLTLSWGAHQVVLNAGPPLTGGWHHVAAVKAGALVSFYIDGAHVGTVAGGGSEGGAGATGTRVNLGTLETPSAMLDGSLGPGAVFDRALSAERIAAHHGAGFDTFVAMASGAHLGLILDVIGWPAGLRSIDAGRSEIIESTPSGKALDWLLAVAEDAEGGTLHVTPAGVLEFRQRISPETSSGTFGDGAGETRIQEISSLEFDDEKLWTMVRVEPRGGQAVLVRDQAAVDLYGERELSSSDVLISQAEAPDKANYLLGLYKAPHLRPDSVTFRLGSNTPDAVWLLVLARQVGDRILVNRRPAPAGSPVISLDARLSAVDVAIERDFWEVTWTLVPYGLGETFWLLGVVGSSELGVTTVLGY